MSVEEAAEIRQGVTRLARRLRAVRTPGALSNNKLGVLGQLYRGGPRTPGELAAAEHQRPQSLTRVFAELEAEGLVARTRAEDDGRQSLLSLTDAGREALRGEVAERDEWLARAMEECTDTEREVLLLAARLMDRLSDVK
ncbi:MarR family winged helix-turn-helix transcriptional regulator [Streptomyces acidiscabies]|uniref:MarR family transcriptional regulator n=1 Tax=Streptomyces acidiscabies TaxID=42234 RepID=A0AAP6B6T2_9ACTN|nr:MarR family transcriptional regulator [Streptomyces acidiscabies]MBP5939995.1 MarR family transcriptional regulator [Streptomyces sp. LBUM 1476]MBZ3911186.1 MarR family transcriptional regulator [Streptomyces acidiscabies]MDX2959032.1 MarR family transcriptional regulator [Streptomyces acidiscabies]MDX3023880.1 MarR family transcriptional regulator [Streptomyces acidiscabies]MDX3788299.1 MarR family transcriptional regulator [Streptomyces acidiscabies]